MDYKIKLRLVQIRKYASQHLCKTEADMKMVQHLLRLLYLK